MVAMYSTLCTHMEQSVFYNVDVTCHSLSVSTRIRQPFFFKASKPYLDHASQYASRSGTGLIRFTCIA